MQVNLEACKNAWTEDDQAELERQAQDQIEKIKELLANPTLAPGILATALVFAQYRRGGVWKRLGSFLSKTDELGRYTKPSQE